MTRYIDKVGVELEGAWHARAIRAYYASTGHNMGHDGSVSCECDHSGPECDYDSNAEEIYDEETDETRAQPCSLECHEIQSFATDYACIADLNAWIMHWYPEVVDSSCGFHIHVSLTQPSYMHALACQGFFDDTMKALRAWGHRYPVTNRQFWDRLEGNNGMCEQSYRAAQQLRDIGKPSARYSALNYCYALHGTLELRVLPQFKNPKTAIAALHTYVEHVRLWLSAHTVPEHKAIVRVSDFDLDEMRGGVSCA